MHQSVPNANGTCIRQLHYRTYLAGNEMFQPRTSNATQKSSAHSNASGIGARSRSFAGNTAAPALPFDPNSSAVPLPSSYSTCRGRCRHLRSARRAESRPCNRMLTALSRSVAIFPHTRFFFAGCTCDEHGPFGFGNRGSSRQTMGPLFFSKKMAMRTFSGSMTYFTKLTTPRNISRAFIMH